MLLLNNRQEWPLLKPGCRSGGRHFCTPTSLKTAPIRTERSRETQSVSSTLLHSSLLHTFLTSRNVLLLHVVKARLHYVDKSIGTCLFGLGLLHPVKCNLNDLAYHILDNTMLPTLWTRFAEKPFLFQHNQRCQK